MAGTEANQKKCSSCASLLSLTAFNRATHSRDGRAAICRRCASAKRRQSTPGSRGKNAIRAAIKHGNRQELQALLKGAAFDSTPLLAMAAQNYSTAPKHQGHAEIVDFLLAQGAKPDRGMLLEAARDGSSGIVDRLLAAGAARDIFVCAASGDLASATKLMKRDRGLARAKTLGETVHYREFTPLHCCCLSGLGRQSPSIAGQLLQVAKLLVKNGADIDAQGTFYGSLVVTPLDMAAHTGGDLPLSRFLIDQGAQISGFAFLEALSHRGRSVAEGLAMAELFLERGFEVNGNAWKQDGTPLHAAANSGAATTVRWLLEHGADVNARGRLGRTPLHLAAERNTATKTVELLLESGADLNAQDDQGLTALEIAQQHGKAAVATRLKAALAAKPRRGR